MRVFVDLRRLQQCGESIETYRTHMRPLGERRAYARVKSARFVLGAATDGGSSREGRGTKTLHEFGSSLGQFSSITDL